MCSHILCAIHPAGIPRLDSATTSQKNILFLQTQQVSLEQFLQAFQDSIDISDNATKILPVLTKHIDKFTAVEDSTVEDGKGSEEAVETEEKSE